MDQLKNMLYIFIYILSTYIVCSLATEAKCYASDNVKWNKIKRECVTCPECPPGQFRNLTEPYLRRSGIHGDEQCLRCRPCPKGSYSESGNGQCTKCRMNCTEMNREYDETCSSVHDAKCGSCLNNYEDIYGHRLLPCSPKKSLRLLDPHVEHRHQLQERPASPANQQEYSVQASTHLDDDKDTMYGGTIAAILISSTATVILLSVVVTFRVRNRRRCVIHHPQGSYHEISGLSQDSDIEIDALKEETAPKTHILLQIGENTVRSELDAAMQLPARPELTRPASTLQLYGMVQTLQLSDGSVVSFQRNKDICQCRAELQCMCLSYSFPVHTIDKSDEIITVVASEVCHDPFPLFRKLGLKDPVLYQENDTRDRDPENITQKEFVTRLLNIWIESKSSPTSLQQLSNALCEAQFHNINTTLYNLCINNSNNGGSL